MVFGVLDGQIEIIYNYSSLPFPISDWEVLQERTILCNKIYPDLAKKQYFTFKEYKYYLIFTVLISQNIQSLQNLRELR